MDKEALSKYGLLAVFLILLWFSYLTIQPYITYLLASVVLVIIFYPIYQWLVKRTKHPRTTSLCLVLAVIALLVVPSVFLSMQVFEQAPAAYENIIEELDLTPVEEFAQETFGVEAELNQALDESVSAFSNYVVNNIGDVLQEAMNIALGLFVMFFIMYYLFTDGPELIEKIKQVVPLPEHHQQRLYKDIYHTIHGIINGMVIIGVIQGILGGIIYFSLGVPNAIFWALATTLVSIIPVIGAFIVWMPIAAWLFVEGEIVRTIVLIVLGSALSQVDNVLRPIIVSKTTRIHPALVIIGVFGGLATFGFMGFILGPLILALLATVMSFYKKVKVEAD